MRSINDEVNVVRNRTVVTLMYGYFRFFFLGKAFYQATMDIFNPGDKYL